jgi:hypothetical protein
MGAVSLVLFAASGYAQTYKATMGQVAPTLPAAGKNTAVRPFTFHASDEALADLRRRITATKWPSRELVTDASQGVQLATLRELARYWATGYDWPKFEARLNALPQFITTIDGVDIHSSTFARNTPTRCRSLSRTDGPARSSSS